MKIKLSPVVAGTMNWGVLDKKLSVAEMSNLILICLENKITTFDHADIMVDILQKHHLVKLLNKVTSIVQPFNCSQNVAFNIFPIIEIIALSIMIIQRNTLYGR